MTSRLLQQARALDEQLFRLARDIGTMAGTLERKGMYEEQNDFMHTYKDLSAKYRQVLMDLPDVNLGEILAVREERNQAFSEFLREHSARYAHIASLPDVPVPVEKRKEALRDIACALTKLTEPHHNEGHNAPTEHFARSPSSAKPHIRRR